MAGVVLEGEEVRVFEKEVGLEGLDGLFELGERLGEDLLHEKEVLGGRVE